MVGKVRAPYTAAMNLPMTGRFGSSDESAFPRAAAPGERAAGTVASGAGS